MAFIIKAAIAATRSSSLFGRNVRSIESITFNTTKRRLRGCSEPPKSLLHRFRRKRALSVTDFTDSEWCEKKKEFTLLYGMPRITNAMEAGRARHEQLEQEVVNKLKDRYSPVENIWAKKFMNFIICANQLFMDGLTRELPLLGFVKGVWMVGVIDEIRIPVIESARIPSLVETKTRSQSTLPAESQKRNGRLQLMCYKCLWDNVVIGDFPANQFFKYFGLDPKYILPNEIQERAVTLGFEAKSLEDLVVYFRNTCSKLPQAHDQLLLRYEYQRDNSLLGEDHFRYNPEWLDAQIESFLNFWSGKREAKYVPLDERWKCHSCQFVSLCPSKTTAAKN